MAREVIGDPIVVGGRTIPLSPAIRANGLVFASGQLGLDAQSRLVGDDIESQTRAALDNLAAVLEAGGATLADIVKATAFITDASLAPGFNAAYAEYFPDAPPARSTVVCGLLIPGALVEIEAIAALS